MQTRMRGAVRPRVLVFGSLSPPGLPCGLTQAVRNLLDSGLDADFEFRTFSTHRQADPARRAPARLLYAVRLTARSVAAMIGWRADLVDVHTASGPDFRKHAAVVSAARATRRPSLLRLHGGDFQGAFERAGPLEQRTIRRVLRLADRVVVLSEQWAERLREIEPRTQLRVVPNSLDCAALAARAAARPADSREILMLANLSREKGHFEVLEAAAALAPSHPDARFVLAGAEREPGVRVRLEERVAELDLSANVRFAGALGGADKDAALARAGIAILPSHLENAPVSIMEAMAAGLPVVASRVGAIPEMVEDGVTGALVAPRSPQELARALARLLDSPALRAEQGRRGQARARALWDRGVVAAANRRLYTELLAAAGSPSGSTPSR